MPDPAATTALPLPKEYVFIVTYGRSGSTVLQALLNTLPGYQVRGENQNALYPLFQSWKAVAASPDMQRLRRAGDVSDATHPWYGAENTDPDAYRATLCRAFSATILHPGPGIRVSGFKEIRTIPVQPDFAEYLGFIREGFPNAKFVFNTRDPDKVVRSSWWRAQDPAKLKPMIARTEAAFRRFTTANPDCAICLHHDDYVADHTRFAPLWRMLGARPAPDALARVMATRLTHATQPPADSRRAGPVETWA